MCSEQRASVGLQRYGLNGRTMGTRYTAVFYADAGMDTTSIEASLFAAVDEVDRQMSTWNPASDLCRLNAAPVDDWITVPAGLLHVLETGLRVARQSGDAFDMAVGDLVQAWGFGPSPRAPSSQLAALKELAHCTASANLEVDPSRRQVRKLAPVVIDLCGIAKGHGVDRLAQCLDGCGIGSYLVGIDGEMRARGSKPNGSAWAVGIEKPVHGVREVSGVLELHDAALATSGDYRHEVELDGRRFAHTMNPGLRHPVSNRLAAVTVLATTCILADAWATALLVLGEDAGVSLAQERGLTALFVVREGNRLMETWIDGGTRQ